MANRLTDTTIWKKQKWFKKLPVEYKLAWKYLTDECNHAGIWKIDISELLEDLGMDEFDFEHFLECCNKDFDKKTGKGVKRQRVMHFHEDFVWLTGFMTFQYGGKTQILATKNNAVPSAIAILKSFNLYDIGIMMKYYKLDAESPSKPLKAPQSPLPKTATPSKPLEGGKDKDKDIDKDKVINNTLKITNTLIGEEPKKNFNTKPVASDFNGLPDQYITSSIEFVKITKKVDIDRTTVTNLWGIFKTKNLNGNDYYANEGKVYSHFLDSLKYQTFTNGTDTKQLGTNKFNAGAIELLNKLKNQTTTK